MSLVKHTKQKQPLVDIIGKFAHDKELCTALHLITGICQKCQEKHGLWMEEMGETIPFHHRWEKLAMGTFCQVASRQLSDRKPKRAFIVKCHKSQEVSIALVVNGLIQKWHHSNGWLFIYLYICLNKLDFPFLNNSCYFIGQACRLRLGSTNTWFS